VQRDIINELMKKSMDRSQSQEKLRLSKNRVGINDDTKVIKPQLDAFN
jgi:hypothetical protein